MPDLDVLRGQGAIPGKPLQAMSGPAPLPPWADVARSFTPIGGVDEAARNLAEAEHAGDYGRGAAAVGQGVASALPVVGRMGRVSGAAYGGLVGAFPALAAGPAEAQQAPAPIDDGLTADQRGRRALLLKQQQKEGLPRALRTELEGINRISEQYAAGKNAATIEAERKRKENELAIQREQGEQALAERTRQVQQAEAARDKALGEVRPDFETRFPGWASLQHTIPIGAGAITGAILGGKGAYADRKAMNRWWDAVTGAQQNAKKAPAKAAAQTEIARHHSANMPEATFGSQLGAYALPASLGAAEGAALANMPQIHDSLLPSQNPQRRAWEQYRNTLPMDHPDRERAQAIIDSMPERNPAQKAGQEALTDWPRMATRTGIGIAEGAGGALVGKNSGRGCRALGRRATARRDDGTPRDVSEASRTGAASGSNTGTQSGGQAGLTADGAIYF